MRDDRYAHMKNALGWISVLGGADSEIGGGIGAAAGADSETDSGIRAVVGAGVGEGMLADSCTIRQ